MKERKRRRRKKDIDEGKMKEMKEKRRRRRRKKVEEGEMTNKTSRRRVSAGGSVGSQRSDHFFFFTPLTIRIIFPQGGTLSPSTPFQGVVG